MDPNIMERQLSRMGAFLIVFLTWVAMYLPALGLRELRGEEGRRVLPAVNMVYTGEWLVPRIGGEGYYRKPPMINWLVAASFMATGVQDELSARLPSVVFTLAFVALLIWLGGNWLRIEARLLAALFFLTSFAMIDKGRQIEIEAVYIAMTSMAILLWLTLWATGVSRWALWLLPAVFLMMGILTKGPPILVFFYTPVICILAYSRRLRALLSVPHIAAVVLWLGIPALWAYLAWRHAAGEHGNAIILNEPLTRLTSFQIPWGRWLYNVAKSVGNLLPWGLFLPLLWRRDFLAPLSPARLPILKGARLGLVLSFLAITLIPGNSTRYAMPVVGLQSILLGWILGEMRELPDRGRLWRGGLVAGFALASLTAAGGFLRFDAGLWPAVLLCSTLCLAIIIFRERAAFHTPVHLAFLSALLGAVLMLQYALFILPLSKNDERRPLAAKVNALLPDGETIYAFKPGPEAFLFYVRQPLEYLIEPGHIDQRVRFLLVHENDYQQLKDEAALVARQPETLCSFATHIAAFRLLKLPLPPQPGSSEVPDALSPSEPVVHHE